MMNKKSLVFITSIVIILLSIILIVRVNIFKDNPSIEYTSEMIEMDLILNIGIALQESYQAFGIEYDIISNDEIILEIKLAETLTDNTKNNIRDTVNEMILKYNYNPDSFKIIVSSFVS